jgi:hypothetical protein
MVDISQIGFIVLIFTKQKKFVTYNNKNFIQKQQVSLFLNDIKKIWTKKTLLL